jgi:hypothetical protein
MTRDADTGRFTPYEMVFGVSGLAAELFPAISEEIERRGPGAMLRDEFARLDSVAALVGRLVPDEAEAAAIDRSLDLLFHCFHFWRSGCRLYAFEEPAIRDLIEAAPDLSAWSPRADGKTLYLELPRNLLWAAVTDGEPPEPVEGMFVRIEPEGHADVLIVLGMRAGRPGFSAAAFAAPPGAVDEIEDPDAFSLGLPGADLAGLYSMQRLSEALLLALRALWYLDRYPESAQAAAAGAGESDVRHGGPTGLEHVLRVRLVERSRG